MLMDFLVRSLELDTTGWIVLIMIGMAVYTLVSQMLGDHASALLVTPLVLAGSAIGNRAAHDFGIFSVSDKIMNTITGMSAGMLVGAILAVILLWSWNAAMAR